MERIGKSRLMCIAISVLLIWCLLFLSCGNTYAQVIGEYKQSQADGVINQENDNKLNSALSQDITLNTENTNETLKLETQKMEKDIILLDSIEYQIVKKENGLDAAKVVKVDAASQWVIMPEKIILNEKEVIVKEIAEQAFSNCKELKAVVVPDCVEKIDDKAFGKEQKPTLICNAGSAAETYGKAQKYDVNTKSIELFLEKTEILVDENTAITYKNWEITDNYAGSLSDIKWESSNSAVAEISEEGIVHAVGLGDVNIQGTYCGIKTSTMLNVIGENAIDYGTEVLASIETVVEGDFSYYIENSEATITKYTGNNSILVVPASLGGYSVRKIGAEAFSGHHEIAKVQWNANTITAIDGGAFRGCTGISEVTIPKSVIDGSIFTASRGWFGGCTNLKRVTFEQGATIIPEGCLRNIPTLTTINIPNSVKEVGSGAFEGCTGLTEIPIMNGVSKISAELFSGCTGLKELNLRSGITAIDGGAFRGCTGISEVTIPKSVIDGSIFTASRGWFVGCTNLKSVTFEQGATVIPDGCLREIPSLTAVNIPDTVKEIGPDAFKDCPNISIYGKLNSCACLHAIENDYVFVPTDDTFSDSDDICIDRNGSSFVLTASTVTNGYISFDLKYKIKDTQFSKLTQKKIKIQKPLGAELLSETLKFDGNAIEEYSEEGSYFEIPVNSPQGNITFSMRPTSSRSIRTYALFEYQENSNKKYDIIGVINQEASILSIEANKQVSTSSIKVAGVAPVRSSVDLYVDGLKQTSVYANAMGNYSAELTLNNPIDYMSYVLKAKVLDVEAKEITSETNVEYCMNAPVLNKFTMRYDAHTSKTLDLLNHKNTNEILYFNPSATYSFEVGFANNKIIDKVYVINTRNNQQKELEATYDSVTGLYYAIGPFDLNNKSYMPGKLSVRYTEKQGKMFYDFGDAINKTDKIVQDAANRIGRDTTVLQKENEPGQGIIKNTDYIFTFNAESGEDLKGQEVKLNYKESSTAADIPSETVEEWRKKGNSYYAYNLKDKKNKDFILYEHFNMEEGVGYILFDKTVNKVIDITISDKTNNQKVIGMLESRKGLLDIGKIVVSYAKADIEASDLRDQVTRSDKILYADKEKAYRQVDELKEDKQKFLLASTLIGFIMVNIALGPVAMGGAALMMTAMMSGMSMAADVIFERRKEMILGGNFKASFVYDPSGYVYEAFDNNRLEGVTTTLYYRENASSEVVLWNAEEYNQSNPLVTDKNGVYAWDVPEGQWQVKYEKNGYETAYSAWLDVPPPQTEVNMSMVSKERPAVAYVNASPDKIEIKFNKYMKVTSLTNQIFNVKNGKGGNVAFKIEIQDQYTSPNGQEKYADTVLLKPEKANFEIGSKLNISAKVQSYAGVALKDAYTYSIDKFSKITAVEASKKTVVLSAQEKQNIPLQLKGDEEGTYTATCISDNPDVVECDNKVTFTKGKAQLSLKALTVGNAIIKITLDGTSQSAVVFVAGVLDKKAFDPLKVERIQFESISKIMDDGTNITMTPAIYPFEARSTKCTWSSSNTNVATVDQTGKVIAKAKGKTIISVKTETGEVASVEITVLPKEKLGDVDNNSVINASDALMNLRHSVKEITLTGSAFICGDVIKDGVINATDALKILRYSVKEITSFD